MGKSSARPGYVVIFFITLLLLGGCSRQSPRETPGEPTLIAAPTPSTTRARVAVDTPTPLPSATPTPIPPPFPTPEVDLTDFSPFLDGLKPAFGGDIQRLTEAPHYWIEAHLTPGDIPAISGIERVRYTNQENAGLDAIYFRLFPNLPAYGGSTTIERVIVDNRLVTPTLEYEGSALRVSLAQELAPGESTDITLWFTSTLPTSVVAGTAGSGLYGYLQGVYDLAGFYPTIPVFDEEGWNLEVTATFGDSPFTDIAFYQVSIKVPEGQSVIASGTTVERSPAIGGGERWRIVAGPVRSFYAAVSDRLAYVEDIVDGTQIRSYYPIASGPVGGETALTYTRGALTVFNRLFGEYPYRELDVIPVPTTAFGMEYAGLFALAWNFYGEGGGSFSIATPHEVAHQWWFNLIGNDQPDEPWLDESLANYSVYLYYEEVEWPEMQSAMMNNVFQYRYQAAQNLGIDRPVGGPVVSFEPSNYINIVYSKGPLFLHAVRQRIGDEPFFAALADYAERHRYGVAYPEDLYAAFGRHSEQDISDLIAFWIEGGQASQ